MTNWQPWQNFLGKKTFWGKIYAAISRERKVAESSNLVKLVFRSVKTFERKPNKKSPYLNAFLNGNQNENEGLIDREDCVVSKLHKSLHAEQIFEKELFSVLVFVCLFVCLFVVVMRGDEFKNFIKIN